MQASAVVDRPASSDTGLAISVPRKVLFGLFFVSGFCGLLYQVVWTRMAFASFAKIPKYFGQRAFVSAHQMVLDASTLRDYGIIE